MYKFFLGVFELTLILYALTLFFASYVGVYLTYVAVPVIVISGVFVLMLKPKPQKVVEVELTDEEKLAELKARLKKIDGDC